MDVPSAFNGIAKRDIPLLTNGKWMEAYLKNQKPEDGLTYFRYDATGSAPGFFNSKNHRINPASIAEWAPVKEWQNKHFDSVIARLQMA